MMKQFLPFIVISFAVVFFLFMMRTEEVTAPVQYRKPVDTKISLTPTNFSGVGTLSFENPGSVDSKPLLTLNKPINPPETKRLVFDPLSFCATSNGAAPCIAMSVPLDVPFNGETALVEGNENGEEVLVRKIQIVEEGQEFLLLPSNGNIFISWPKAQELIKNCEAKMISQSHSLNVDITLENGEKVRSVEPIIDDVFKLLETTREKCGDIPIAME